MKVLPDRSRCTCDILIEAASAFGTDRGGSRIPPPPPAPVPCEQTCRESLEDAGRFCLSVSLSQRAGAAGRATASSTTSAAT